MRAVWDEAGGGGCYAGDGGGGGQTITDAVALILPRGNALFLMRHLQRLAGLSRQRAAAMLRPGSRSAALAEAALFDGLAADLRAALAR